MQLSPLQSRLVASLAAISCLLILYLLLLGPKGAVAYELPLDLSSGSSSRPDWASIEAEENVGSQTPFYEPIFNFLGRSILGRAGDTLALENDRPLAFSIQAGDAPICYVIKKGSLFNGTSAARVGHEKRDNEDDGDGQGSSDARKNGTIYISANTCLQPMILQSDGQTPKPPQMVLFLSNGTDTGCPQFTSGHEGDVPKGFSAHSFEEGAVTATISNATSDIYVGVYAPKIEDSFEGAYDYQIAASSTEFFHQYQSDNGDGTELLWMDSDSTAALLITRNLTDDAGDIRQIWSEDLPYYLYVSERDWPLLDGLRHSACGLAKNAPINADYQGDVSRGATIKTSMTLRGPGGLPKQQFYVVGLNATTSYIGALVRPANVTVNLRRQEGGGIGSSSSSRKPGSLVFQGTAFRTSAAPNCKVVTDLDFCDEIQYAVPGNDAKFNNTELAKVYDAQAKAMYDNFLKVMQQIQCETDKTSRYSLARTCEDCKRAYKRWLCTVSLPRCEDFRSDAPFSIIRNVNQAFPNGTLLPADVREELAQVPAQNASRNAFIDQTIQPGPYNELMPCEDICYQVVQSCPAATGFSCPQPGMYGFNVTYGRRVDNGALVSCNFPGEARTRTSAGRRATMPNLAVLVCTVTLVCLLMVVVVTG